MQEIQASCPSGLTLYVVIRLGNQTWNNTTHAFESSLGSNQPNYAIALVEVDASGYYLADFPIAITQAATYTLTLYSQLGGTPSTTDNVFGGGTYYWPGTPLGAGNDWITLAEYKAYANITNTNQDAQISTFITQASAILTKNLKRNPVFSFYAEVLDGTPNSYLTITNYPINSLTSVTQAYQTPAEQLIEGSQFLFNEYGTIRFNSAPISQSFNPRYFQCGFQNYLVNYSGGYSPFPPDLKYCCEQVVQWMLAYAVLNPFTTSKRAKDVSVVYGRMLGGDFSDPMTAGIEAILALYRQPELL